MYVAGNIYALLSRLLTFGHERGTHRERHEPKRLDTVRQIGHCHHIDGISPSVIHDCCLWVMRRVVVVGREGGRITKEVKTDRC